MVMRYFATKTGNKDKSIRSRMLESGTNTHI